MFRLQPKPRRTEGSAFCPTKCDSCDYTRTEGARVVLTLPVSRKRLRRESETSGHDARNVAAVKTMPRSKRSRAVRTVVGLLAALASAAENFVRFSAALGAIDIGRREPAKRQPY